MPRPARLYLDIDDVLFARDPLFDTEPVEPGKETLRYSPEVAKRLGATGLDLVWLTSWQSQAPWFGEQIGLNDGRTLLLDDFCPGKPSLERKVCALRQDQRDSPAPFVWIDDSIKHYDTDGWMCGLTRDRLLISPNERTGLSEPELQQIEDFSLKFRAS